MLSVNLFVKVFVGRRICPFYWCSNDGHYVPAIFNSSNEGFCIDALSESSYYNYSGLNEFARNTSRSCSTRR